MPDFSFITGKTITSVYRTCNEQENDELVFEFSDGMILYMTHEQDCCERVYLSEVIGDFDDLLDTPILEAYVSTSVELTKDVYADEENWTFYRIATIKGTVTLRWCGTSNGYYSTSVDLTYSCPKGKEKELTV